MRFSALVSAALLAPAAFAFRDSTPFLIYSSEPHEGLREAQAELTSGVISAHDIYGTLSSLGCDWETLVLGRVEDTHQSRLNDLKLPSKPADLHLPYLLRPNWETLEGAIGEWAKICGAEVTESLDDVRDGKTVIKVDVKHGEELFASITDLPCPQLVILTGSLSLSKRQEAPLLPSQTTSQEDEPSSTATDSPQNSTLPTGPLLDRVLLLTVPVITGLLVTFVLFIPILYIGISALVGIQVPPRMLEIGKGVTVGKDRKDQ